MARSAIADGTSAGSASATSRQQVLELLAVLQQQYPGILRRYQRHLWKHARRITQEAHTSHRRRRESLDVSASEQADDGSESSSRAGVVVGRTHVYCYRDTFNALEVVRRAVTHAMSLASVRVQAAGRMHVQMQRYRCQRRGFTRLQALVRGRRQRRRFRMVRSSLNRLRMLLARWRYKCVGRTLPVWLCGCVSVAVAVAVAVTVTV